MTTQTETQTKAVETAKPSATPARRRMPGFTDLFDDMDRFWDTLPAPWRFSPAARQRMMAALDVFEKDGKLQINAELPGLKDKDIEIEVADDVLAISGEKRDEREVKEDNYYRSERTYGSFRRQVVLPTGADTDNIEATFSDGILRITMPMKAAASTAKKIAVKAA